MKKLQCEHWPDPEPERMTKEEKASFFDDFCAGQIYTDRHVNDPNLVGGVFMALGLATPMPDPYCEKVGVVWEHLSKAGSWMVNGHPMFMTMNIMHRDDWDELRELIREEQQRRQATRDKIVKVD